MGFFSDFFQVQVPCEILDLNSRSSTESALVLLSNTVANVDCPERFNLFLVMG